MDKVGLHDNFFDLGGHSLLLVRVHGKLQKALDREIPMVAMFKYPTISAFAKYLSRENGEAAAAPQRTDNLTDTLSEGKNRLQQLYRRRQQAIEQREGN